MYYTSSGIPFKQFWHAALYVLSRGAGNVQVIVNGKKTPVAWFEDKIAGQKRRIILLKENHGIPQKDVDRLQKSLTANNRIISSRCTGDAALALQKKKFRIVERTPQEEPRVRSGQREIPT